MAHFDEKSGVIPCKTEWGSWWQTIDEVFIEINSSANLNAKEIKCTTRPTHISVMIKGNVIFEDMKNLKVLNFEGLFFFKMFLTFHQGALYEPVHSDDTVWTLEDKRVIRICLSKAHNTAAHCWPSLLVGKYKADPYTLDEMQKKLTLQRFQYENPGMDFSGASMTGNYHGGGPQLPS